MQLLAFLGAFALLVCDAAAGLACGLAGSLALTAAAVLCAVAQIAGVQSFDMFHTVTFYQKILDLYFSIPYQRCQLEEKILACIWAVFILSRPVSPLWARRPVQGAPCRRQVRARRRGKQGKGLRQE